MVIEGTIMFVLRRAKLKPTARASMLEANDKVNKMGIERTLSFGGPLWIIESYSIFKPTARRRMKAIQWSKEEISDTREFPMSHPRTGIRPWNTESHIVSLMALYRKRFEQEKPQDRLIVKVSMHRPNAMIRIVAKSINHTSGFIMTIPESGSNFKHFLEKGD